MKKIIYLCISLYLGLQMSSLQGQDYGMKNTNSVQNVEEPCCAFSTGAKVGAYFLLGSDASDIYGPVLPAFTWENNLKICKYWNIWLDGSFLFGNGSAQYAKEYSTHLNFVPITLGLKFSYPIVQSMDFYVGAGAAYSFLLIKDRSPYVHRTVSSNNWGAVAKSGFIYHATQHLFLDGFIDYTYQKFHFCETEDDPFVYRNDANLSGIEVGLGIGYTF